MSYLIFLFLLLLIIVLTPFFHRRSHSRLDGSNHGASDPTHVNTFTREHELQEEHQPERGKDERASKGP